MRKASIWFARNRARDTNTTWILTTTHAAATRTPSSTFASTWQQFSVTFSKVLKLANWLLYFYLPNCPRIHSQPAPDNPFTNTALLPRLLYRILAKGSNVSLFAIALHHPPFSPTACNSWIPSLIVCWLNSDNHESSQYRRGLRRISTLGPKQRRS